jgi:mono/diheme cytochrome c family protein
MAQALSRDVKVTWRARHAAGVLAMALLLAGCAAPAARPTRPEALFASTAIPVRDYSDACGTCHDRGGFAVRVLTDRLGASQALIHQGTRLSPEAIRTIVRRGLGAMPAMSRIEVSDAELDRIVAYIGRASRPQAAP